MYLSGFGNHHQSEAITGALPKEQNSPQHCDLGLYAEQLSGSSFTRPRHCNLRSWLYRKLPSVVHTDYAPYSKTIINPFASLQEPNPMRWSACEEPVNEQDFIDGLFHIAGNRLVNSWLYYCNQSMNHRYFSNRDGEMMFVPYSGRIRLNTEFGGLDIAPGMIALIPRGTTFKVELIDGFAAGYLCENSGSPFTLPNLGLIGSNGLANPRHFLYPTAAFEDKKGPVSIICKYQHHLWEASSQHSPLNVVAWHGNYAPYCYDLALFNTLNTVSFDHPDPSIFTVLTSESEMAGVANLDFVIFPPRWMVAEHTFRPPYFHRNVMNELMGLLVGQYDAKSSGFDVGGVSIHNCMTSHGPDTKTYEKAITKKLKPTHYQNTLAFMFESREPWLVTEQAMNAAFKQRDYAACWQNFVLK